MSSGSKLQTAEMRQWAAQFDTPIPRHGTASTKWNRYAGSDILPLWVADMDFASPPAVLQALHRRVDHGVFGYTDPPRELIDAVMAYLATRHGWTIQAEWLVWLPGLVPAIHAACGAVGRTGDAVTTFTPVYYPFLQAPARHLRQLVRVPLNNDTGRWAWDDEQLLQRVPSHNRLFLLCNPHNPVGRVWTTEELERLAEIALLRDWVVCADEVHCDLVFDGHRHTAFGALSPDIADRTIALYGPTKTYNLAGIPCTFAVIPNADLRGRFVKSCGGLVPRVTALGYAAAHAAYTEGEPWRQALLAYLSENRDVLAAAAARWGVPMASVEATYLAWLDLRRLGADYQSCCELAGVGPSDGRDFGLDGYVRVNFGCPKQTLQEALRRLSRLFNS